MKKYIIIALLMAVSFAGGVTGQSVIDFFSIRKFPSPAVISKKNYSFRYFYNVDRGGKRIPMDVEGASKELTRLLVGVSADDVERFFYYQEMTDLSMKGWAILYYRDYIHDCQQRLVKFFLTEKFGIFDGLGQWSVVLSYDDEGKVSRLLVEAKVVMN